MALDVRKWLEAGGFGEFADRFEAERIDADALRLLTDEHLRQLGIPIGPRAKLLAAIRNLSARPVIEGAGAERRRLTVMFTDLVGSTALARRFDPEDFRAVMDPYLKAIEREAKRYDASIARYEGDGALLYFGHPVAHEDDAERAVRAALAIVQEVAAMRAPDGQPLAARVGIATGLVVVGDLVGEGAAREYAAIGETPILARRLQGIAEPGSVVLSDRTRALIGELFDLRNLGLQALKGMDTPVAAYAATGERPVESRFEAHRAAQLAAMVGRDGELALLRDRWRSATLGEGQVVFISGEGGIGKSRILRALEHSLAAEPHYRIHNQCSPYHSDSALFPVVQQLSRAAGIAPGDGNEQRLDRLQALMRDAPREELALVAALMGIDGAARFGPLELPPQQQRLRTFEALVNQTAALAKERPVLWILEDAHWVDPTTLELVEACIARISGMRILAVITARPEFQHDLGAGRHVTRIALNRLGRAQIGALVTGVSRGKALPERLVEEIAAKTDGVPLFVEELTKMMLESGFFQETQDAYVLEGSLRDITVPASLHDILMARLDRSQPLKELAQIASCIGREFDYGLLANISGVAETPLRDLLARLVEAELVFRRGPVQDMRYAFKHALVRDAAYESLLKAKRQQIHTRVVGALEERADTQPELVAYHAAQAGLSQKAVEYWQKAGASAIARPAYKEAISHLSQALRVAEQMGGDAAWKERRLQLMVALGQASIPLRGYSHSDTVNVFLRARELADSMNAGRQAHSITYAVWVSHYVRGEQNEALETARSMLRQAEQNRSDGHRLTALRALGISQTITGAPLAARDTFGKARELGQALRERSSEQRLAVAYRFAADPEIATQFHVALALWALGETGQGRDTARRAVAAARAMGHAHTLGHALAHGAFFAAVCEEADDALELSEETLAFSVRHDMDLWHAYGYTLKGYAFALRGDLQCSVEAMDEGLSRLVRAQTGAMVPLYRAMHARTLASLGRIDEADREASAVRHELHFGSERYFWPECSRLLGEYLELRGGGDPAQIEAAYASAAAMAREQHARAWEARAAASLNRFRAAAGSQR